MYRVVLALDLLLWLQKLLLVTRGQVLLPRLY